MTNNVLADLILEIEGVTSEKWPTLDQYLGDQDNVGKVSEYLQTAYLPGKLFVQFTVMDRVNERLNFLNAAREELKRFNIEMNPINWAVI